LPGSTGTAAAVAARAFVCFMKIIQKQLYFYWLPVMMLCVLIFVLSCFPSPDVGPSFPLKDKVLHMTAYGVLAALFFRACRATWPGQRSSAQLLAISVCFATLYGLSDEFHQAFVAARQADGYDLLADFMGSIIGATGYLAATHKNGLCRFSEKGR
jgi:VanZ family protein